VTSLLLAAALLFMDGSGTTPTIPDCFGQVVAPRELTLACGDGSLWVGGLRWRGWGTGTASAVGMAHANDCKPYCAAGHFHAYPVEVAASRPAACLGGRRQYTRLALRYTVAPRPGVGATETERFPCAWPLHPGLTARRSGETVVFLGRAWGASSDGCPARVVLASGTTMIATAPLSASGGFRVAWQATPGRHVVVVRQTCRGGSLREAAVVVR
jgi:hypothetical protein